MIHASYLYTGQGIQKKDGRFLKASDLAPIEDGAIVYDEKKIHWVGKTHQLPRAYLQKGLFHTVDLKNEKAIIPGLIDSHTHLVFAGSRGNEFVRRCSGATYQEIAKEGGGIQTTVQATRSASENELYELALKRVKIAHSFGVRTLECKSGYGLDHATEIKCLKVIQKLKKEFPLMTFVSTYLGAHGFPKGKTEKSYLNEMIHKTLPQVSKEQLTQFCDIFIDEGYYNLEQAKTLLQQAKKLGLKLKVHADELTNTESAKFAVQMKAHSADHLLKISKQGIQALAKSKTVATLLPGTAFYLKEKFAPARELLKAGAKVAIATDFNPGSCYSLNLPLMLNLSALYMGMSEVELFAAVTYNAASALGLEKRKGVLAPHFDSDFVVLPYARFDEMIYRMGW